MSAGFGRRALVTIPLFLFAILLISIGAKFAVWGVGLPVWGVGIVIFGVGLALILPQESLRATLHTSGVAHHRVGDPTGAAGIGAVLRSESGEVIGKVATGIGVTTNTVADYAALVAGLQMALDNGVTEVNVYVDSPVIEGHLLDGYRVRADHLRPLVEHVRQLLDVFSTWSLTRVPRKLNLEADRLANGGIEGQFSAA